MEIEKRNFRSDPPKPLESSRRERLSDEEMGNLISAVGNHEAKAITLGLMQPHHIYPMADLKRLVNSSQGERPGWITSPLTPWDYCRYSFVPIGLVAQEVINSDLSTYGYMKTEYGSDVGEAFAGLILDFSLKHPNFSLQDFFGSTNSKSRVEDSKIEGYKNRSPITRLKIFWELLTSDLPVSIDEVARNVGQNHLVVGRHLRELAQKEIVSLKSPSHSPRTFYRPTEKQFPGEEGGKISTKKFIMETLKANSGREFTREELMGQYINFFGKDSLEEGRRLGVKIIDSAIQILYKDGYIKKRHIASSDGRGYSEVSVKPDNLDTLFDLVNLMDKFQAQDSTLIEYGKRRLKEINANPQLIAGLMRKAREHSNYASHLPLEELDREIKEFILQNPRTTQANIVDLLRVEGRSFHEQTIRRGLLRLVEKGEITFDSKRGERHYQFK